MVWIKIIGTSFIKVPSTVVSNSQCEPSYPNITNFNDQFICTLSTYSVYFYPFNCPVMKNQLFIQNYAQ